MKPFALHVFINMHYIPIKHLCNYVFEELFYKNPLRANPKIDAAMPNTNFGDHVLE